SLHRFRGTPHPRSFPTRRSSDLFFPASSEFASLMMTFAVFGAGFLMRPIGAIVLGAYIDKVGRRKGLITTLSIMAAGTFLIVLRSEEHTSDLQSREKLVCRLLLE